MQREKARRLRSGLVGSCSKIAEVFSIMDGASVVYLLSCKTNIFESYSFPIVNSVTVRPYVAAFLCRVVFIG
jgi:hypothetical protein